MEEETSTSESPISNITQDHLFPIFLLLPVESILSLSLTCKRFRALTSSDSLWESICRRDWGSTCVDALKSSNHYHNQLLPWMTLYKQVSQLKSLSCHKLADPDYGDLDFPSARASHSLNFVSDCLVLFGGGCEGGQLFSLLLEYGSYEIKLSYFLTLNRIK